MTTSAALLIITLYFVLLISVAQWTSRGATSATFFNADKSSPWPLVAFGAIGATVSGVTFVSVPGEVATNNWHYLQFVAGNFLGYWVIAFVLLPLYYKLKLISIYDYLDQRFGPTSHRVGALFFMLSQLMGASFRLFLVIGVLQILVFNALGVPLEATAAVALVLIWIYIRRAGIKTVVWTDTLQTVCILAAVAVAAVSIKTAMCLDAAQMLSLITTHTTCKVVDTDVLSATFAPKQLLAGLAIVIVMNGLDQNIMQKNLTCKSAAEAKKNMCWFSLAFLAVNVIFIGLGTLLCLYAEHVGMPIPAQTDSLFPTIVNDYLPASVGVAFLLGIIAASFSSADSSLTALTTVWCIDIMRLSPTSSTTDKVRNRVTISMVAAMFVVICIFSAINDRSIVSAIFTVAGYTYGPLLGLFSFGLLTKRKPDERFVPYICVLSPVICLILSWLAPLIFFGYRFGFELLIVNGAIVFAGLFLVSKSKK